MKKSIFACLLTCFCTISLLSQSDFRPGYIINNKQDTTFGLIDYKGNKANAKKCLFRTGEKSEIQEFTPEQLKAYRFIDSKYYISKKIVIDTAKSMLFLEYLINGVVDIFYYRDGFGEHYLAEDKDGALYELRNDVQEVRLDGTLYEMESKKYIGVLTYLFRQSPQISKEAENTDLNHKSLINIAHEYNTAVCPGEECIIYEKKLPRQTIIFGPVIGIQFIKATIKKNLPNDVVYLTGCQFEPAISPLAGLFINFNLVNRNERMHFQFETSYSAYALRGISNIRSEDDFILVSNITQECDNLNNTATFQYEFPSRKIKPTVLAGLFFDYTFHENYNRDLDIQYPSGETYYEMNFTDSPFSKSQYGLSIGCGIGGDIKKHRRFFVEFKYQRGLEYNTYKNMNYFILDAGIHFGK
jgi:hypothetical protein